MAKGNRDKSREEIRIRNTAESYLKIIRDDDRALKGKKDELDALRYRASGAGAIRYDKDHVQTSPQDYLSMAMDDIVRIEKEILEMEADVEKMKGSAYAIIRKLHQDDHRTILEWYYLNGLSMSNTAERMNIAERTAYYLREDALESFGRMIKGVV